MNIKMMLAQEAANKYDDMKDAECYYEMLLGYYTRCAVTCYKNCAFILTEIQSEQAGL